MDDPEDTGLKREIVGPGKPPREHQFKPGNPGRPKGSRNRLGEQFLSALADDFDANGIAAIAKVREDRPHEYLKVVASILPKELTIRTDPLEEMSDAELDLRIKQLASALSLEIRNGAGAGIEGEAEKQEQAGGLSSLH